MKKRNEGFLRSASLLLLRPCSVRCLSGVFTATNFLQGASSLTSAVRAIQVNRPYLNRNHIHSLGQRRKKNCGDAKHQPQRPPRRGRLQQEASEP